MNNGRLQLRFDYSALDPDTGAFLEDIFRSFIKSHASPQPELWRSASS